MKRYIVVSFLLSIKFLLISCHDHSSYITYSINWIDNGSLKLTLINNSKNDYYFAFKSLEQPNNPGPYYSSFSVLKIEEKVNFDSLRNLAFQNYLLSNKTNGFDYSPPPGLDSLNKKKILAGFFFFIPAESQTQIIFNVNMNKDTNLLSYPVVLKNLVFEGRRKKVIKDFYSKGAIGGFKPYLKPILKR